MFNAQWPMYNYLGDTLIAAVSNVRHLREAWHPEPANKRGSAPIIFVEWSDEYGWRGSAPVILSGRRPSLPGLTENDTNITGALPLCQPSLNVRFYAIVSH